MKQIINFSMNNKFAVWLITIIITAAGLYSGLNMKLETIPDIDPPIVTVTTTYPGATPEEVADEISEPLEQQVENLNGVKTVSSSSFQNASSLQLEYSYSKDLDEAEDELQEAVDSFTLPEAAQEPDVSRVNFNAFPVISMSVLNENGSLEELTSTVNDTIVPELEGLEGVADVQVSGQQVQEVQMNFDEEALQENGLDQETVTNYIQGADVAFPLGLYTFDDTKKSVVMDGNVTNLEDLKNLEIPLTPSQNGQGAGQQGSGQSAQESIPTVPLSEVANLEVVGQTDSISRTNGEESISIQIVKSQEANTVDVVNLVKDQASEFEEDINGIEFVYSFDQGEPIEESVSTMLNKALFGGLFAVAVILLFLRNFRTTIISVISIPLSLFIALIVLNQMGITLNIMTLGAMTVAIGRVVDDSIVVVENIYRRMSLTDEKLEGKDLIRSATKEMFMPILSSTIVTIAVFLPLGLVEGVVGQIFLPFALTVVFALLASLVVAITIVPMLSHSLLNKKQAVKSHKEGPGRMAKGYKKVLNSVLNHKIITSLAAVAILAGSIALIPLVGVSFLPSEEEKMVMPTYSPAPGQTVEDVEGIAENAYQYFADREDVENIQYSVGGENPMNPGASNQAAFFVEYNEDTENFSDEKQQVMDDLKEMTDRGDWSNQDFSSTGSSSDIQVQVFGDSTEEIKPYVEEVTQILNDQEDLSDAESSLSESYEEYTLVANPSELSSLGLTAGQVGQTLSPNRERPEVTTVQQDGEELQVYLEIENDSYESIDELTNEEIQTPLGQTVQVDDIAEVEEGTTEDTISRQGGQVYASVSATSSSDDIGSISADVQEEIDNIDHPASVDLSIGGVTEDINESFSQLGLAMIAAIAIVYLVLVIFFGGALAPFAILFALPFTIIGAVLGLLIGGETLSISAMIGGLMLIGIVVTNGIVLIDRVIQREKEGFTTREALLDAGTTRLRPILMTALATIGALLPLALGLEGGSIISKGLGLTVIGGLASSTLLTLLIVPVVYELLSKIGRKKRTKAEDKTGKTSPSVDRDSVYQDELAATDHKNRESQSHIVNKAEHLFIQKGYTASTMAEVAQQSEMKEQELNGYYSTKFSLLSGLIDHSQKALEQEFAEINKDDKLTPSEKIYHQIEARIKRGLWLRKMVHQTADAEAINMALVTFSDKSFIDQQQLLIASVYDQADKSYSMDAAVMLNGLTKEYVKQFMVMDSNVDSSHVTSFLMECLDGYMTQLNQSSQAPILTWANMSPTDEDNQNYNLTRLSIKQLREMVPHLNLSEENQHKLLSTLDSVEEEVNTASPNKKAIKWMLSYLTTINSPVIRGYVDQMLGDTRSK